MRFTASARGSTPEIAKKQVCSTVLIRPPVRRIGDLRGIDDEQPQLLVEDALLDRAGQVVPGFLRP